MSLFPFIHFTCLSSLQALATIHKISYKFFWSCFYFPFNELIQIYIPFKTISFAVEFFFKCFVLFTIRVFHPKKMYIFSEIHPNFSCYWFYLFVLLFCMHSSCFFLAYRLYLDHILVHIKYVKILFTRRNFIRHSVHYYNNDQTIV